MLLMLGLEQIDIVLNSQIAVDWRTTQRLDSYGYTSHMVRGLEASSGRQERDQWR
jgi:hypothetical protein